MKTMKHHHFLSGSNAWIFLISLFPLFFFTQCSKEDKIIDDPDPASSFEGKIVFTNFTSIYVLEDRVATLIYAVGTNFLDTHPHHPRWSPDGMFVTYHHATYDNWGIPYKSIISIIHANGSDLTSIYSPHPNGLLEGFYFPSWSPNGDIIASCLVEDYSSFQPKFNIETNNVDGSHAKVIARLNGYPYGFDWSPDGSKFAVLSSLDGVDNFLVLDADGSTLSQSEPPYPVNLVDRNTIQIRWSPDNQKILLSYYWSDTDRMQAHVMMLGASLAESELITDRGAFAAWSPDGSQIAYLQPSEANHGGCCEGELFIMDLDSREKKKIASKFENYDISGRYLDWH